jgi:hypothetical protein
MTSAQTSGSTRRSPALVAAIAAAAALAITAVIVLLILQDDRDPAVAPSATGPGTTAAESTSGPPAAAATPPTAAPPGVTWALVGQAAVPASASEGPARLSGCVASGFAHTPTGALIAAAQISTRSGYSAGRSCWEPTITGQFTTSADREALLTRLKDADAQGQPGAAPGELAQLVAFRFMSYTASTAVVGLIRRSPQGGLAQTTLTLTWVDGDWKLVAPPGGQWPTLTTTVANLAGSVAWGAS